MERFLQGHDAAWVDYAAIDADVSLDQHWADVERQDAEDRYFAGEDSEAVEGEGVVGEGVRGPQMAADEYDY